VYEKVCINTSPAPERCVQILPRLLRRRRSISIYIYLSDTSQAPEKPGKYLKTPYLAPERQEMPEKYLYTPLYYLLLSNV